MLLAIDPGMNSPGVALFLGHELRAACRIRIPEEFAHLGDGHRWRSVAAEIVSWAYARGSVEAIIYERPQWYTREKSKGDPNKLAGVLGVAANVTGLYGVGKLIYTPTPAEWIGQLSKVCPICRGKKTLPSVHPKTLRPKRVKAVCPECHGSAWETPRGRRIRSRLTEAELALVPDQNDAIDAVGLGLFQLGRLTPRSVFSNGHDGR